MSALTFKPITAQTPGFLKRQIRGARLQAALASIDRESNTLKKQNVPTSDERYLALGERTLVVFDDLVAFVLAHVETPRDAGEARAIIEDMSQDELTTTLGRLMEGAPPLSASSSESAPAAT